MPRAQNLDRNQIQGGRVPEAGKFSYRHRNRKAAVKFESEAITGLIVFGRGDAGSCCAHGTRQLGLLYLRSARFPKVPH